MSTSNGFSLTILSAMDLNQATSLPMAAESPVNLKEPRCR